MCEYIIYVSLVVRYNTVSLLSPPFFIESLFFVTFFDIVGRLGQYLKATSILSFDCLVIG